MHPALSHLLTHADAASLRPAQPGAQGRAAGGPTRGKEQP
jgi:hypothetical protein